MKKTKKDMLSMLVFMILCAVTYFVFIPTQIKLAENAEGFNNRTFPQFTMIVIFLAATAGFVRAFRHYREEMKNGAEESKETFRWASQLRPYIGFLIILAYALLFHYISIQWRGFGFIIGTAVFIPVFLLFIRCRKWQYYAAAYAFAAGMYLIFRFILRVAIR